MYSLVVMDRLHQLLFPVEVLRSNNYYAVYCCCLVTKSCLTLSDFMNCGLPGSSVHAISQTRTLEWVAVSFSSGNFLRLGIKPASPTLPVDSLPPSWQGSPLWLLQSLNFIIFNLEQHLMNRCTTEHLSINSFKLY